MDAVSSNAEKVLPGGDRRRAGQRRSGVHRFLLLAGASGVLFIATFLALGFCAPGYSFSRDTISALELTSVGVGQQINFFVFGVLLCLFAAGLRLELQSGRGATVIPLLQGLSGLGVVGDAVFVRPPLHLICDLIAFNCALGVLLAIAWRVWRDPRWKGWGAWSLLAALAMMGFLTAFGVANHHRGPAGLMEKLAALTRTLWSVLLVAKLLGGASLAGASDRPV